MDYLGNFIISHNSMVVMALLGAIILCVFGLLLTHFHHPKDAVAHEVGSIDRIEGALRQILAEQAWPAVKSSEAPSSAAADNETIATPGDELEGVSAPATDGGVAVAAPAAPPEPAVDLTPYVTKIKELEEKLAEYSVIEEDIADLSRFRQENDELRKKITHATGVPAEEAAQMPWDDFEKVVKEKSASPVKDSVDTSIEKTE